MFMIVLVMMSGCDRSDQNKEYLNSQTLDGDYIIFDDVLGEALIGYRKPHPENSQNYTPYTELMLLNLEQEGAVPRKVASKKRISKIDGNTNNDRVKFSRFDYPCFSTEDDRIYRNAYLHDADEYLNLGSSVLLSISREGYHEMFTSRTIGQPSPDGRMSALTVGHYPCHISINTYAYPDISRNLCDGETLPFTCQYADEREEYDYSTITFDLRKQKMAILPYVSAERKEDWPVEVEIVETDGTSHQVSLPLGDFVRSSGFFKQLSCFSCGCGCYQDFRLTRVKGRYYLVASGWAFDDDVRGVFVLNDDNSWDYIFPFAETVQQGSPTRVGECYLMWEEEKGDRDTGLQQSISWINLCNS